VKTLMAISSEELVPVYQHLLETDFKILGSGSTSTRQYWIVSMESAIFASKTTTSGRVLTGTWVDSMCHTTNR